MEERVCGEWTFHSFCCNKALLWVAESYGLPQCMLSLQLTFWLNSVWQGAFQPDLTSHRTRGASCAEGQLTTSNFYQTEEESLSKSTSDTAERRISCQRPLFAQPKNCQAVKGKSSYHQLSSVWECIERARSKQESVYYHFKEKSLHHQSVVYEMLTSDQLHLWKI